jgi:hypothetical protein
MMARRTTHPPRYQTELRTGVAGNGTNVYLLYVMQGSRVEAIHRFTTKAEALAFHKAGAAYGPLDDQSY